RRGGRRRRGKRQWQERREQQKDYGEPYEKLSPAGKVARRMGYIRLHPEQEQIIAKVLEGKDVLVILPTGFGKSMCYQIPAMRLGKPTVLISPLIALMQDQQEKM